MYSQNKLDLSVHGRAEPRAKRCPETCEAGEGSRADGFADDLEPPQAVGNEFILVEVSDACHQAVHFVANMLRRDLPIACCYPQRDRHQKYADENKL
jgi:hypothetical protein